LISIWFLNLAAARQLAGDEQDPVAGHRELQWRFVLAVAALGHGGGHRRHAGMRHQSFERSRAPVTGF
jgi:hypothetical protein